MKRIEVEEEKRRIVVNPIMAEVYNKAAELGKKIVFVSDMYLTEDIMRDILMSKGITEFDGLYTSCSRGCGKQDGSLLRCMTNDLGVDPQKTVHIGDNRNADMGGGARACMYVQYVPTIADTFFDENKMLRAFFADCGGMSSLHMRLIFGALVLAYHLNKCRYGDDPWRRTGITYTAPIYYSYMRWVLEQSKAMSRPKLLLVLRDCHVIGKMLDRVAPNVDYRYLVASRAVLRPVMGRDIASLEAQEYIKYAKSVVTDPSKSVLVEGTSVGHTAEKGVGRALGYQLPTLYMSLGDDRTDLHGKAYLQDNKFGWSFGVLENIACSPENPYTGIINGKPVCKSCNNYDVYRSFGVKRRESAAVEAATLLHDNGEFLAEDECRKLVKYCFDHADLRDATHFINQFACADVNHTGYRTVYWK